MLVDMLIKIQFCNFNINVQYPKYLPTRISFVLDTNRLSCFVLPIRKTTILYCFTRL